MRLDIIDNGDGTSTWTMTDMGNPQGKPHTLVQGTGDNPATPVPLKDFVEGAGGSAPFDVPGEQVPKAKCRPRKRNR